MLGFFRKYQQFFFLIITVVIIISFSFFGVMNQMINTPEPDPVAFKAIDGERIKRKELEQMSLFLGTDAEDKIMFGGVWGPNFLNDGVIQKDFLETGLATVLAGEYKYLLNPDYTSRINKESRYKLYRHPEAEFLSVENAWGYLAPEMKTNFQIVRIGEDPLGKQEFDARIHLYLGQKKLSPQSLKQVLLYQKRQYSWVPDDPNFINADLSIFGYHTTEDWFGTRMVRLISAVIINSAKLAEERGIRVSSDEALASLLRQAHVSYNMMQQNPNFRIGSAKEYMGEQLRRMGMTMDEAVHVWQEVLLFRRLFDSYGDAVFVDLLPFEEITDYSQSYVSGNLYTMPDSAALGNFRDLQKLELYLDIVAKKRNSILEMPTEFLSANEVEKKAPELVQTRFKLDVATYDAKKLVRNIGVKETWKWQLKEENWELLQTTFPDLGIAKTHSKNERFASLEALDDNTRAKVDTFSRERIAKDNPEMLREALANAKNEIVIVGVRKKGKETPFAGMERSEELYTLLRESQEKGELGEKARTALQFYTQDNEHYFTISVLEQYPEEDILAFSEVRRDGTLDHLLNQTIENHYEEIREKNSEKYKAANGSWKPIDDVRSQVAQDYFSKVLQAIEKYESSSEPLTIDDAAKRRYSFHLSHLQKILQKERKESEIVADANETFTSEHLNERPSLNAQWKLKKTEYKQLKNNPEEGTISSETLETLSPGDWTETTVASNGQTAFFALETIGVDNKENVLLKSVEVARLSLANQVKQELLIQILANIREREEISFEFLDRSSSNSEIEGFQ